MSKDEYGDCPICRLPGILDHVGSATGLKYYRCSNDDCGTQWREKRAAAVASGSIGGQIAAANMTPEQRKARAKNAVEKRWEREKLDDQFQESVSQSEVVAPHRLFRSKRLA